MGVSAELLVRDKLITCDEFKAIYRDISRTYAIGSEEIT